MKPRGHKQSELNYIILFTLFVFEASQASKASFSLYLYFWAKSAYNSFIYWCRNFTVKIFVLWAFNKPHVWNKTQWMLLETSKISPKIFLLFVLIMLDPLSQKPFNHKVPDSQFKNICFLESEQKFGMKCLFLSFFFWVIIFLLLIAYLHQEWNAYVFKKTSKKILLRGK